MSGPEESKEQNTDLPTGEGVRPRSVDAQADDVPFHAPMRYSRPTEQKKIVPGRTEHPKEAPLDPLQYVPGQNLR